MIGGGPARPSGERGLVDVARRVRLLGSATPINLEAELARVIAAWSSGRAEPPRFAYARPDLSAERAELSRSIERAAGPHAALHEGKARELLVEARACEAVGTPAFWPIARERFPRRDACDDEADRLAAEWSAAAPESPGAPLTVSDDASDPASLLSSMRREVGALRLPFRVKASRSLAPLAAVGDGVIYVAAGRRLTRAQTARAVLHEVHGHAVPAARAARSAQPHLQAGTAFGSDDQEGRALLLEERGALLDEARRRELALRHVAARSVEGRADFVETARRLLDLGAAIEQALRIAARVHRGGGLGREAAYLPAYVRVRDALASEPALEDLLAAGRVSVSAARSLASMRAA